MSFGTAESLDAVPAYLARIRGGRPAPDDLVAEFRRRFQVTGGSPLLRITREQAAALEVCLNRRDPDGPGFRVRVGMRHSAPFIADSLKELAEQGVRRAIGIIMAPQHSPMIMAGYHKAAADAAVPGLKVAVAEAWHTEPRFVEALTQRVREAIDRMPSVDRGSVPVLFTAHSLPRQVVEQEPQYLDMLRDTAVRVAAGAGLGLGQWQFAYQSAGHTPQEWLRPDIRELFPSLAARGHRRALIAPVQFVADHLEVLYDIDVAAREQAAQAGIELSRIEMLNTMPAFIEAMADVVWRHSATQS
jgi:ferrochelatase